MPQITWREQNPYSDQRRQIFISPGPYPAGFGVPERKLEALHATQQLRFYGRRRWSQAHGMYPGTPMQHQPMR
jgi:hypothetical protein